MADIHHFTITPISMLDHNGNQRIKLQCWISHTTHVVLKIESGEWSHIQDIALTAGDNNIYLMVPSRDHDCESTWFLISDDSTVSVSFLWKKPREWVFYVMLSSHTDIGLHNSQYHQRYASEQFLESAAAMCDATDDRTEENRYRYTMEGRWFWENYPADKGAEKAENLLQKYIRPGKIGLCAGTAGNHTNVYGFEELCRSAYVRSELLRQWNVDTHTMSMIDNNGLSWAMVAPYADAGYQNIIFAPNHWNPLMSQVWECDRTVPAYTWNTNAGGGGSRIDVRYDSALPMLFFWESPDHVHKLLVWASVQYARGGEEFGFLPHEGPDADVLYRMESRFSSRLPKMEERYPYDIWLLASYGDDQNPSLHQTDLFTMWNEKWAFPKIRTLGAPDEPFDLIRERYEDQIPVLQGEITGGWYQHPVAAPQLLADKLEADRRLANAETYASLAARYTDYTYPAQEFSRAWNYLIWNDEHSYGTSGYQGRRVYETWMQHRNWIEKAAETAKTESSKALDALIQQIPSDCDGIVVFNPTAQLRSERISWEDKTAVVRDIPSCGYKVFKNPIFSDSQLTTPSEPPEIENEHYRIRFAKDGSMESIFDKEIGQELIDSTLYGANTFVFTEDNHKTFITPKNARFTVYKSDGLITVTAEMEEPVSGAAITQKVTLDSLHHRIDIDNTLQHIRAMINTRRYYRYIYYAFPFTISGARRICQLNGCEAEYAKDLTGHSTDTYMSSHEWALAENTEYGAALLQRDSLLVEFDHIHPDKTDFGLPGTGSAIYSYVSNDWLQMHEIGGSHVHLRLRYAITSWSGSYKKAGVPEMAECWINPVAVKQIPRQNGIFPKNKHSFLTIPEGQRLICLKRAEDGQGIIARLYGDRTTASVKMENTSVSPCTTDEQKNSAVPAGTGFSTFRIHNGNISSRPDTPNMVDEKIPAPVGSCWTGLIDTPKAFRGENDGQLYLLWGQNQEKNLSHYELYRGNTADFIPSPENLIARVEPEQYCVGRYVDEGLMTHTAYYYRVRAVNQNHIAGKMSDVFSGITKEPIEL